jgi:hypothetical protein
MALRNLKGIISTKNVVVGCALVLALGMNASAAFAAGSNGCKTETGKAVWTLVPAPNDQLGRIVGPTTGTLKAATSAYLTDLQFGPVLHATSVEVWVLGPQDILVFNGEATFTPVPGAPFGTVADDLTLTAIGGTGKYDGASGTLHVTGTGYNVFGPDAGPGSSYFDVRYTGTTCTTK